MNEDESVPEQTGSANECARCGAHLTSDARFCPECGTPVATQGNCPSCGQKLQPGERFCRYCGTQVAAFMSGRAPVPPSTAGSTSPDQPAGPQAPVSPNDLRTAPRPPATSYRPLDPGGITCPRCGARGRPQDSFCNSCGLPFDEQPVGTGEPWAGVVYAGLLSRLVARIIDGLVASLILLVLFAIVGTETFFIVDEDAVEFTTAFYLASTFVSWGYHAGFLALWATTPGKRVMGMRVEPVIGSRLGLGRSVLREGVIQAPSLLALTTYETAALVSPVLLVISLIIALSRPDRRMLHDLVAGTAVQRDRP